MGRFLALVLVLPALFGTGNAHAEDMELTVKPVLCIIDSRNPSCEMSFIVMWRSGSSGYYCLYNDFGDAPVRCWTEEREGQLTDERDVRQAFSFWMTSADGEVRLAQVDVEVLRMDSDDRRRKRRTRHVWDIN